MNKRDYIYVMSHVHAGWGNFEDFNYL